MSDQEAPEAATVESVKLGLLAIHKFIKGCLELAPLLTPLAIMIGYMSTWALSARLGVATGDLGLGLQEYLILAFVEVFILGAVFAGVVMLQGKRKRTKMLGAVLAGLGLACSVGPFSLFGILLGVAGILVALIVQSVGSRQTKPIPDDASTMSVVAQGLAAMTAAVLVLLALQTFSAGRWGKELRVNLDESSVPLALALVINTSTGVLAIDGVDTCALRITSTVYITGNATSRHVEVLHDPPPRFVVTDCLVGSALP